jgi:signal transduction histidine kinase
MTRTHEAGEDVRRLVYELRPPALDDLGLVGAIREVAAGVLLATEPRITAEMPQLLPPISAAVELAAYRIARAALANVASHAEAHTCSVRLWLDAALNLEVVDDGRGLPTSVRVGVGLDARASCGTRWQLRDRFCRWRRNACAGTITARG